MKKLIAIAVTATLLSSCTDNQRVKDFGGLATINLPAGEKLVHITWKTPQIWYLTRPMIATDTATTYRFQEISTYGIVQGTYIIVESK